MREMSAFTASPFVYLNGEIVPRARATVSVLDHGFLFGDGCFESLAVRARRVFMLDAHCDRLERSLRALALGASLDRDQLGWAIATLVKESDLNDALVKVIVTRGAGGPTMDPRNLSPTVVVMAEQMTMLVGGGAEASGLSLKTAAVRRTPPWGVDAKIKSLNYLNLILARLEAISAGKDDALLLDEHGEVAEATGYNVVVVRGDRLVTPASSSVLQGITRQVIWTIAQKLGFDTAEERLTLVDVYAADEVFLTSTAGGVIPVREVDGRFPRAQPPGPVTIVIRDEYETMIKSSAHAEDLDTFLASPDASTRHRTS